MVYRFEDSITSSVENILVETQNTRVPTEKLLIYVFSPNTRILVQIR